MNPIKTIVEGIKDIVDDCTLSPKDWFLKNAELEKRWINNVKIFVTQTPDSIKTNYVGYSRNGNIVVCNVNYEFYDDLSEALKAVDGDIPEDVEERLFCGAGRRAESLCSKLRAKSIPAEVVVCENSPSYLSGN